MMIVGLVGGVGPESTIDYYRRILASWGEIHPKSAPSIVIDSLDVTLALHLVATDRAAFISYLATSVHRLTGAGVDFIAMTANTAHLVFDEIASQSSVPLVSIVDVCAEEAQRRCLQRLLLLGTRFTMEGPFYPQVFGRHGLKVVTPHAADRVCVHDRYVGELLVGNFRDETRAGFVALIERLKTDEGVDGVILGGTELPLLLQASSIAGLPLLDTTALHVAAIVARLQRDKA
jgi:aspartate racemase